MTRGDRVLASTRSPRWARLDAGKDADLQPRRVRTVPGRERPQRWHHLSQLRCQRPLSQRISPARYHLLPPQHRRLPHQRCHQQVLRPVPRQRRPCHRRSTARRQALAGKARRPRRVVVWSNGTIKAAWIAWISIVDGLGLFLSVEVAPQSY